MTEKGEATPKKQPGKTSKPKTPKWEKEKAELEAKQEELNDRYIRLSAEFDNYRKRTLKEKMELVKSGGEGILLNILPVVDNLDRAMASVRDARDLEAVKNGIELIYNKFREFLDQNGIKEIDCLNQEFDTDKHEALTQIAAPQPELKGKVVDVIEKGYSMHDKVIRFAKVIVGE